MKTTTTPQFLQLPSTWISFKLSFVLCLFHCCCCCCSLIPSCLLTCVSKCVRTCAYSSLECAVSYIFFYLGLFFSCSSFSSFVVVVLLKSPPFSGLFILFVLPVSTLFMFCAGGVFFFCFHFLYFCFALIQVRLAGKRKRLMKTSTFFFYNLVHLYAILWLIWRQVSGV